LEESSKVGAKETVGCSEGSEVGSGLGRSVGMAVGGVTATEAVPTLVMFSPQTEELAMAELKEPSSIELVRSSLILTSKSPPEAFETWNSKTAVQTMVSSESKSSSSPSAVLFAAPQLALPSVKRRDMSVTHDRHKKPSSSQYPRSSSNCRSLLLLGADGIGEGDFVVSLFEGAAVGTIEGVADGCSDGVTLGMAEGAIKGLEEGASDGKALGVLARLGVEVGTIDVGSGTGNAVVFLVSPSANGADVDGSAVGADVGAVVGAFVGAVVGAAVGAVVGAAVGAVPVTGADVEAATGAGVTGATGAGVVTATGGGVAVDAIMV